MDASTKSNRSATGTVAAQLSREIVRHHARLVGRGPTRARSYLQGDFAMCAMEDIFTVAERTLIDSGAGPLVREARQALLGATRDELVAIFERVAERPVRPLVSQTEIEADFGLVVAFFERGESR
ncbi:MAG: Na-translocating system protein MpsC family protein [Solirubrobacterales bacterium]